MSNTYNTIELTGTIVNIGNEYIDHKGLTMHNIMVEVCRRSGLVDTLKVVVPNGIWFPCEVGDHVVVAGRIASRNVTTASGSRLILEVIAEDKFCRQDESEWDYNEARIREAYIVKEPVLRQTPMGRTICDTIIAVNHDGCSSYIPTIGWEKTAVKLSKLHIGDCVHDVRGRFQSREYQKTLTDSTGNERQVTRTAYELSLYSMGV